MDKELELVEHKASILIDALPYIRDFNQKTVVIEYGCAEWLSGVEEQRLMQDIVLLKSVGMRPIVVHATRMGLDKFRENKRIAKLLELCGVKAIGICGVDTETIGLMLDNDYIPVIVPNDIDNESEYIDPRETALEIAEKMQADKLVYLSKYPGIYKDEERKDIYYKITVPEVEKLRKERNFPKEFDEIIGYGLQASKNGVNRVHILDGRIRHVLLIEFFSVNGAGTIFIETEANYIFTNLANRRRLDEENDRKEYTDALFDRIYLGNSFCSTERGDGLYRALYIYLCTLFDRWDFSDSMYLFSGQMACEK